MNEHSPLPADLSRALLALLVLCGIVLCYFIAEPFFAALVWSITLAVLFAPLERALRSRLRSPAISVSLTLLLAALLVVIPVLFVSRAVIEALLSSAQDVAGLLDNDWRGALSDVPGAEWAAANLDFGEFGDSFAAALQSFATGLLLGSLASILTLLLTFYFLFYFLRDGKEVITATARHLPLTQDEFAQLATRLRETIFATVWGIAVVSMVQGLLGGLMFWWLGLPSPVFWGSVMGLLAIVPFLGAFIIWVPAAILLALNGQWISAVVLTVWGTLIVGLIDNVLYPVLVGRQLAQHSVVAFIAIVGGIAVFGAHGFVLGPLVVAATMSLLEILRTRLDRNRAAASS